MPKTWNKVPVSLLRIEADSLSRSANQLNELCKKFEGGELHEVLCTWTDDVRNTQGLFDHAIRLDRQHVARLQRRLADSEVRGTDNLANRDCRCHGIDGVNPLVRSQAN